MMFGSSGKVLKGSKQIATVETWSIEKSGGSETDWSGGLTATWSERPELGTVRLQLTDSNGRGWSGTATITDLPFRLPADRKAEIGVQGSGPLTLS